MAYKPSQLQRQAEEVAQIEQQIASELAPPAPVEPPPATPEPPKPVEPAPLPPPAPPASPPQVDWEQRYRSLEGKYKAEVPRLHAQVKELTDKVSALAAAPKTTPAPTPTPAAPAAKQITAKDTENFGEDLIDMVRRQVFDSVGHQITALTDEIKSVRTENEQLKAQLSGVTQNQGATAHEILLSKLTAAMPDWETINANPAFLDWLDGTDPLSGLTRQQYIDNAMSVSDVPRIVAVFNAWKATQAPAPTPTPAPAPAQSDVQRQVEPGKSKNVPTGDTQLQGKIWTHAEIDDFYNRVRAGHYAGKADEAKRIEADIDLAVSEGRVN